MGKRKTAKVEQAEARPDETTMHEAVKSEVSEQVTGKAGVITMVPTHIRDRAITVWDHCYDAYFRKGGIHDLEQGLSKIKQSLGAEMLELGRMCYLHTGKDAAQALNLFLAACIVVEQKAKSEAKKVDGKEPTIQQILPNWTANKSVIAGALKRKVDLTMTLKNPVTDKMETLNISQVRSLTRKTQGSQAGQASNTQASASLTDPLKGALVALHKELAVLNAEQQNKAAELIVEFIPAIMTLRSWKLPTLTAEEQAALPGYNTEEAREQRRQEARNRIAQAWQVPEEALDPKEVAKRGGRRVA